MPDREDAPDEEVQTDALDAESKEKAEKGSADEERQETETTSQDRLDSATNPDAGPGGTAPYPPKPA